MDQYILDADGTPVAEPNVVRWAMWYEAADRQVAEDIFDEVRISTVFLALNHSFNDRGPPVLYETMIFGGPFDDFQARYHSRDEALQGHAVCREEVAASRELTLIAFDPAHLHQESARDVMAFSEWNASMLRGYVRMFTCGAWLGFSSAADAAIFKLSPWYRAP